MLDSEFEAQRELSRTVLRLCNIFSVRMWKRLGRIRKPVLKIVVFMVVIADVGIVARH
jgi:hypothetical protein